VTDLYLVGASLAGEPRAIALLEQLAGPVAKEVVERHPWCSVAAPDLCRTLLGGLLVAEQGKAPKLAQYGGRGPVTSFLRVCAIRLALDEKDDGSRLVPLDDVGLAERAFGSAADEELLRLKEIYRPVFAAAVRAALANLEARARNLLRLHYLERLPCERIAALYKVNTTTAWRWLDRTHQELRRDILRRLAEGLGAELQDAESILQLVWSRLDDSLRAALSDERAP
jgi:RNA polymerase sigma-70 factor